LARACEEDEEAVGWDGRRKRESPQDMFIGSERRNIPFSPRTAVLIQYFNFLIKFNELTEHTTMGEGP
jgi:hypothetical protein